MSNASVVFPTTVECFVHPVCFFRIDASTQPLSLGPRGSLCSQMASCSLSRLWTKIVYILRWRRSERVEPTLNWSTRMWWGIYFPIPSSLRMRVIPRAKLPSYCGPLLAAMQVLPAREIHLTEIPKSLKVSRHSSVLELSPKLWWHTRCTEIMMRVASHWQRLLKLGLGAWQ